MRVLFDTNILIDYLGGVQAARDEMERHTDRAISVVVWMEVMAGAPPEFEAKTRTFLDSFKSLPITPAVAERAVLLRRRSKLKLPDAIVLATAEDDDRVLVTRNTRDFAAVDPSVVRIPYRP